MAAQRAFCLQLQVFVGKVESAASRLWTSKRLALTYIQRFAYPVACPFTLPERKKEIYLRSLSVFIPLNCSLYWTGLDRHLGVYILGSASLSTSVGTSPKEARLGAGSPTIICKSEDHDDHEQIKLRNSTEQRRLTHIIFSRTSLGCVGSATHPLLAVNSLKWDSSTVSNISPN